MEPITEKDIDELLDAGYEIIYKSAATIKRVVSSGEYGVAIFPDNVLGIIAKHNCGLGRISNFGWDSDCGMAGHARYEVIEMLGNKMICWLEKK